MRSTPLYYMYYTLDLSAILPLRCVPNIVLEPFFKAFTIYGHGGHLGHVT